MTHTETPWAVVGRNEFHGVYIEDEIGIPVCDFYSMQDDVPFHFTNAEANAAHIVKCVNAHDDLVALLRHAYRLIDSVAHVKDEGDSVYFIYNAQRLLKKEDEGQS